MEHLALTSKILYDVELLKTKKELKEYKQKYDYPKINVISYEVWWERYNYVEHLLSDFQKTLKFLYQENYEKYKLFFKEQMKHLDDGLKILQIINQLNENLFEEIMNFKKHFLYDLIHKITWMHCLKCKKLIKTIHGLCENCECLENGSFILADAIDH